MTVSNQNIASLIQRFISDFGLSPVTASEIEFYLFGAEQCASLPVFWEELTDICTDRAIPLFKYEKERGREQYEIALAPCSDPRKTAADTAALKDIVPELASKHGMQADFSAKPIPLPNPPPFGEREQEIPSPALRGRVREGDEPGSGLHIHIHLADKAGKNVFYKDDNHISDSLKFSIGGLLAWMPDCMAIFAPVEASYARFTPGGNAPLTVSWGANNRTAAVRLPDTDHHNKRIEHRVAGADADPTAVMTVILAAMYYGLANRIEPGSQIYGDASLAMYGLPKLPASLTEARERFNASEVLASYHFND